MIKWAKKFRLFAAGQGDRFFRVAAIGQLKCFRDTGGDEGPTVSDRRGTKKKKTKKKKPGPWFAQISGGPQGGGGPGGFFSYFSGGAFAKKKKKKKQKKKTKTKKLAGKGGRGRGPSAGGKDGRGTGEPFRRPLWLPRAGAAQGTRISLFCRPDRGPSGRYQLWRDCGPTGPPWRKEIKDKKNKTKKKHKSGKFFSSSRAWRRGHNGGTGGPRGGQFWAQQSGPVARFFPFQDEQKKHCRGGGGPWPLAQGGKKKRVGDGLPGFWGHPSRFFFFQFSVPRFPAQWAGLGADRAVDPGSGGPVGDEFNLRSIIWAGLEEMGGRGSFVRIFPGGPMRPTPAFPRCGPAIGWGAKKGKGKKKRGDERGGHIPGGGTGRSVKSKKRRGKIGFLFFGLGGPKRPRFGGIHCFDQGGPGHFWNFPAGLEVVGTRCRQGEKCFHLKLHLRPPT